MVLFGTLMNSIFIIVGSLIGLMCTNIPERFKETIMQGIALVVILIGLQMAFTAENIIIVLISLLSGAVIGELISLEDRLNYLGRLLERKFQKKPGKISVAQGFVSASLIFIIGALSIVGSLDSGLRGDHELLITKGVMDGFTALVFTTTFGYGVLFAVIPVILYQGTITLLATQIDKFIPTVFLDDFIMLLTSVGGLMIIAIGLNLLKVVRIRIGNLLPALFTSVIVLYITYQFPAIGF